MNRRLQQFLELEQLKPAQFADIMGIQRSNVSHILSGRNKPGFDFIQRFLLKFPSVNPDWLLLGKGKPLREQNQTQAPPSSVGDLFSEPEPVTAEYNTPEQEEDGMDFGEADRDTGKSAEKEVRRITLFYSDGTFKEFYPPK